MADMNLHFYFERAAKEHTTAIAVEEADGSTITYGALAELTDRVRDRLIHDGVEAGDRVGVYVRKSIDSLAAILGILKAGAAYVPVDPTAPATRNAYVLDNCKVKGVFVEGRFRANLEPELSALGFSPPLYALEAAGGGAGLGALLGTLNGSDAAPVSASREVPQSSLAYILYTSGSTGKPKGVMLSHENATAFVGWCLATFEPNKDDCFSSHAPFHFDLSILDIYTPLSRGCRLVIVPEDIGKEALALAELISKKKITVWYSAPSILAMMVQFGKLETHDYSSLRTVLFAGEVFPVAHLRALTKAWPHPRYYNLYGPTETNVCTHYEVSLPIDEERKDPFPIGPVCAHLEGVVLDLNDQPVEKGSEGELCIRGANVMVGYWNLPEQTNRAFIDGFYRTGDVVIEEPDGNLKYVGRRDRMVKRRGFRVELGEIETILYAHPEASEVAVVAIPNDAGLVLVAHMSLKTVERLSGLALRKFCSDRLPVYMIPDKFEFHERLPKTSTDKIDYQSLVAKSQ